MQRHAIVRLRVFKKSVLTGILFFLLFSTHGQTANEFKVRLKAARHDTTRLRIYTELANALYKQKRYDSLYAVVRRALPLATRPQSAGYAGVLHYWLGTVYGNRGQSDRALQSMKRALLLSRQAQDVKTTGRILYSLSMLYMDQGNNQQALQAFHAYHTLMDSLVGAETAQKITQVQKSYKLHKKEQAIRLLTKTRQFQRLKSNRQRDRLKAADRQHVLLASGTVLLLGLTGLASYLLYRSWGTQKALVQQQQELVDWIDKLTSSNQMKDKLFSILTHDLRSPVASLKASFNLWRMKAQHLTELDAMEQEVNNLSQTLDNTLYWALAQRNGIQAFYHQNNLSHLVADVLDGFEGLIRHKRLRIDFTPVPTPVRVDENLTTLALRNIIHNAIKFTPAGGSVAIIICQDSAQTRLQVADTGIGMDRSRLGKGGREQGTGLGLNLSEELMRLNGGQLSVESKPGQGTVVTFSWPKEADVQTENKRLLNARPYLASDWLAAGDPVDLSHRSS